MASRITGFIVFAIVGVTLIAGLIVGAQRDENGPVDVIVFNGRVFQGEAAEPAEALAIRGNQILLVGSNREVKRLRRAQTVVIDAHGGSVVPGFNDAAVLTVAASPRFGGLDVSRARSAEALRTMLRRHAVAETDGEWVRAWGLNPRGTIAAALRPESLDAAVPDRPVVVYAADGRSAWLNSKALRQVGLAPAYTATLGSGVAAGSRASLPAMITGPMLELVDRADPASSFEASVARLRDLIAEANRLGLTSLQIVRGTARDLELLSHLRDAGELTLRVYVSLDAASLADGALLETAADLLRRYPDDPLLKAGGVTLPFDGSELETERYWSLVEELEGRGWQLSFEDTGLGALELLPDSLGSTEPAPPAALRRIHSPEGLRFDLLPRLAAARSLLIARPGMKAPDTPLPGLSATEASWSWQALALADAMPSVALGSGWPAGDLDPRLVLAPALQHSESPSPDEIMDDGAVRRRLLGRLIDAYTRQPAIAAQDETRKGSLGKDMLADLVIFSTDLFELPPERFLDATVTTTVFDGKVVYSADPGP